MRPHSLTLSALLSALALSGAVPHPNPQTSAADVLSAANDARQYGQNGNAAQDPDLIADIFGVGDPDSGHSSSSDQVASSDTNGHDPDLNSVLNDDYVPPKVTVDTESTDCSHYEEDGYYCVPYYQCEEGEIVVDGGNGIIDIRSAFGVELEFDPENSKCPGYLETCCRHPDLVGEPIFTPPPAPKPKPYVSRCGRHNANGIGVRIQNDPVQATTQFGEWPHMCAVLEDKDDKNLYVCGASLIADDLVMTAAHCVDKLRDANLKVRCGEWDTQQEVEPVPHQDRNVLYKMINPLFSPRNLTSNVAVLQVDEPFELSAHVDTICLPQYESLLDSFDWEHCVATGWGKDKFGKSGEYQVILKQVDLNLVSHSQCQAKLRTVKKLGRFFRLDKTALCAGGDAEVDTCKGDGGGPLVCPIKNSSPRRAASADAPYADDEYGEDDAQYVQAGIVGWGVGCGKEGIPGVYTDISSQLCYIDWATRCLHGDRYPEPILECDDWADRTREDLRYALNSYQYQLTQVRDGSRRWKRIDRRVKEHQAALDFLLDDWQFCANDRKTMSYLEEGYDDQPNLDGFARRQPAKADLRSGGGPGAGKAGGARGKGGKQ